MTGKLHLRSISGRLLPSPGVASAASPYNPSGTFGNSSLLLPSSSTADAASLSSIQSAHATLITSLRCPTIAHRAHDNNTPLPPAQTATLNVHTS